MMGWNINDPWRGTYERCDACSKQILADDDPCPHCGHIPGMRSGCKCAVCWEDKVARADQMRKEMKERGE